MTASLVLLLFLILGAVSAVDSVDVQNTEDSNLMGDNDDSLSAKDKLEISSEDSISETNIVTSHDDNLGDYPDDDALQSYHSYCEDNSQDQLASSNVEEVFDNNLSSTGSSSNAVAADSPSSGEVIAAGSAQSVIKEAAPTSTKLSVSDTHYAKSATYFDVTLKDNEGNALKNEKVSLTVKGKTYSAYTNANGIASVKTASLAVGSYSVSLKYGGSSNYSSSSLSKKVKVLSSVTGSNSEKYSAFTPAKYELTFWKNNKPLSNTKVTFKVNGKSYTATTDENGVASFKIKLSKGKYTVSAVNPYSKQKVSKNIVVNKLNTDITVKSKTYLIAHEKNYFSVVLKAKDGRTLKNKPVSFTYNKKTVTARTNEDGKASIVIPVLSKGTYKLSVKYDGGYNYYSSSASSELIVCNPTTKVSSSDVKMVYGDGTKFKVKLTTSKGKILAKETVKLKIKNKVLTSKTNGKGIATFSLESIKSGTYDAKYYYSTKGLHDYSHGTNKLAISKANSKITAKDLTMKTNDGSSYQLTVKDKSGNVLKGVFVKTVVNGRTFFYQTNSEGVAKLKITLEAGSYTAKSTVVDKCYKSDTVTKHIHVKGNKFVSKNIYGSVGKNIKYSVKLLNEKKKPVKKAEVTFKVGDKNFTAKTDSKGVAKVNLGVLSKGTHKVKFTYESASGSSKIYVVSKVSVKEIISASKKVNKYISKHSKLPSSVKIGDVSLKTADYLYVASKAIVNLKAGKKNDISIKIIDNPSNPKGANDLGYLNDYLSVAKKVVKSAETKGKMPNSVGSKVGAIGYKGIVKAFSKVMTSYGKNNKMPSYVAIKSFSGSASTSVGGLNTKNTISDLAAYLAASKNCEANSQQFKKLVAKLTKNCKTEKEKADAIFKYVKDTISYSFYFNTKYGAQGTLNARAGNCVDHAHLLVAMYRTAGLAARYEHGKCTFNSGHTYGHVWAQVLIGNTWTVADATSSRNSLGKVANWNTKSYTHQGYFSSISF